jgi:hypothetical protein
VNIIYLIIINEVNAIKNAVHAFLYEMYGFTGRYLLPEIT